MTANFVTGSGLVNDWLAELRSGVPPVRFRLSSPFELLDVRPGRLLLLGGAPGTGKTAVLLQLGFDLLRMNSEARLLVANVEMSPEMLLERIIARLANIPISALSERTLSPKQDECVTIAVNTFATIGERLAFLKPPFTLEAVAQSANEFKANVLILDYIQRFAYGKEAKDARELMDGIVTLLRRFADSGACVLCASAVARQKGKGGSTYDGLNLASFRNSSELEFGCDSAYLLIPTADSRTVTLKCEKNRYGEVKNIPVMFDPSTMTFSPAVEQTPQDRFDQAKPAKPSKTSGTIGAIP